MESLDSTILWSYQRPSTRHKTELKGMFSEVFSFSSSLAETVEFGGALYWKIPVRPEFGTAPSRSCVGRCCAWQNPSVVITVIEISHRAAALLGGLLILGAFATSGSYSLTLMLIYQATPHDDFTCAATSCERRSFDEGHFHSRTHLVIQNDRSL